MTLALVRPDTQQAGETRVQEIIRLGLQGQADEVRWLAAQRIFEELESGKTQRQLAEEISKSVAHVNFMSKVWRVYPGKQERSFNECYQGVKAGKPKDVMPEAPTPPVSGEPFDPPTVDLQPTPAGWLPAFSRCINDAENVVSRIHKLVPDVGDDARSTAVMEIDELIKDFKQIKERLQK